MNIWNTKNTAFTNAVKEIANALATARGGRERIRDRQPSMLSPGDISSLARMDIAVPNAAFWRLMAQFVPPELRPEESERRWALAIKGMSMMAPHHYASNQHPGMVLAKSGFSPDERFQRINRLLKSEGEGFEDLYLRVCAFLSSKAEPIDWGFFTAFAIREDESIRNDFARAFFNYSANSTTITKG